MMIEVVVVTPGANLELRYHVKFLTALGSYLLRCSSRIFRRDVICCPLIVMSILLSLSSDVMTSVESVDCCNDCSHSLG